MCADDGEVAASAMFVMVVHPVGKASVRALGPLELVCNAREVQTRGGRGGRVSVVFRYAKKQLRTKLYRQVVFPQLGTDFARP